MQEEITEEKTIENMEMELIAQECSVSTDDVMEYPPTALSLGEKTIQTKKRRYKYSNRNWHLWKL